MNPPPKLPHDVLLIVTSFADAKCLLALLTTCRSLHSDCGKYVLQDPVVLRGDQDIVSFMDFMRPHRYKRWRHLHTLCLLSHDTIGPHIAEELASAIPRASQLEYLEFKHAEKTLGAHPDLPLAFAAVQSVKHIVIGHGRQLTCRMLEAMHWPLESAVLSHTSDGRDSDDPDIQNRMHPAALFKNSCATLMALECEFWTGSSDIIGPYPVYPQLEFLHVEGEWCPRAAQWAITISSHFMGEDEDDFAMHTAARLFNLGEWTTQKQQWDKLEKFFGTDALDLYLLGLPCRIRDIALSLCTLSLPYFAPAMATARPTRLTLSITTDLFSQPIPTYLEDPGLADLESLELDVMTWVGGLRGDAGDIDVDRFLGYVFATLQRASAREFTLFLAVDSSEAHDGEAVHPPTGPRPLSRVETWVNNADPDALVHRFLSVVPSLESVKISIRPSGSDWQRAESSRRGHPTAS